MFSKEDIDVVELALRLMDWHGGMGSGLYAVGSNLYTGYDPSIGDVTRAISELRNLKRQANYPACVTPQDEVECNELADMLEVLYADDLAETY